MRIRLCLWLTLMAASLTAVGCVTPIEHNLPPAQQMMHPGPGVGGPGPGVMPASMQMGYGGMGYGGMGCDPSGSGMPTAVQVMFHKPDGMQVRWDVGGVATFDSVPLVVPGRQNFPQAGIYRLKLTNIVGREGVELYPTLEIGDTTPRTEAYLAHNAIPVQFTEEDFDQVMTGNFVKKVIYLPDPEFQELALANVETLVSTRLDPGMDPITEADRRGAILAVIRLGNKDVELPGANGDGAMMLSRSGMPGGIAPASYSMPMGMGGMPGGPMAMGPTGLMPSHVAGITAPEYGMPYVGTPIGLPGPPHIPLGGPAGLQSHVIKNHTKTHIPDPTRHLRIDVNQRPGYSYPAPPNHARITEQMIHPTLPYDQPRIYRNEIVR